MSVDVRAKIQVAIASRLYGLTRQGHDAYIVPYFMPCVPTQFSQTHGGLSIKRKPHVDMSSYSSKSTHSFHSPIIPSN
jgi:hypothetical protein